MSVNVSVVVESDAVVDAVRLGLSFKAECAVEHLLNTASEIGTVAKEVAYVELNAGLIGIYLHAEPFTLDINCKTEILSDIIL